jgi:hypothetical protein
LDTLLVVDKLWSGPQKQHIKAKSLHISGVVVAVAA